MDFEAHNREVKEVWEAFQARKPIRVPVILGLNVRYYLFSPWLNPRGITFQEYSEDPDLMIETQLEFQYYVRHNLLQDAEMGMPKDTWPGVGVDLQNYYEAAWFGCPVRYYEGQVPDTEPILTDDRKRMLLDRGIPDPFKDGIMAKNVRFWEYMRERIKDYTFKGLPVAGVGPSGLGTDGPFTAAANLRGATQICLDIYEDPEYVRELLDYITEATIARIKAWREKLGHDAKPACWGIADDSIQLLSCEAYREFVLPAHKRLLSELAGPGPHSIHLCGDATRHFKTIRDELNVMAFDTGFPVDFGRLRQDLGPDVQINGGPSIQFLLRATPDEVREEVRRILSTGVAEGGRFVLREGNNLAPGTPVANVSAMYHAAREFGRMVDG
jgi:uroporphyrinogen-III decarboxylase